MERKKKRVNYEEGRPEEPDLTADELREIEDLFNKRVVYVPNSKWSLQQTSVFGRLMAESPVPGHNQLAESGDATHTHACEHNTQVLVRLLLP